MFRLYTTETALRNASHISGRLSDPAVPDATYALKGNGEGTYGVFAVGEDDSWTYAHRGNIAWMRQGETYAEKFVVLVATPAGGLAEIPVAVHIRGDNTAPVVDHAVYSGNARR